MAESWGLTETGFYCPTYEEILAEKITDAEELFGDDISTSALTPLGKFLRIEAKAARKLYEEAERVYYSASPATATGVSLDRAVSFAGITRQSATAAVHILHVYGDLGTVIAQGTMFRTTAGVTFRSLEEAVIDTADTEDDVETGEYYAEVRVQCTELGTVGNVASINSLVTADASITEIAYAGCESEGTDTETDAELYARYNTTISGLGTNTEASIIAAVLAVSGVTDCVLYTESEDLDLAETDNGYSAVVYTSSTSETTLNAIAEAIFTNSPFGVPVVVSDESGAQYASGTYTDSSGVEHTVKFYLAAESAVNISVKYTASSSFPSGGADTIKANIETLMSGLGIGDSFVCSTVYGAIYSVTGVISADLTIITADDTEYGAGDTITAKDYEVLVGSVTVTEA